MFLYLLLSHRGINVFILSPTTVPYLGIILRFLGFLNIASLAGLEPRKGVVILQVLPYLEKQNSHLKLIENKEVDVVGRHKFFFASGQNWCHLGQVSSLPAGARPR